MPHVNLTSAGATVLIALGANVPGPAGLPADSLRVALKRLESAGISDLKVSSFYRTPAVPLGNGQPDYLNAVAMGRSAFKPAKILEALHAIERELGRHRNIPWEARAIDLDLLAVGDIVSPEWQAAAARGDRPAEPGGPLILPHPRLHLRRFVLGPLVEIAPDWRHPALGLTARELLALLPD